MFGCGFLFPLSSSHFIVPVHLGGLDGASRTTLDVTPPHSMHLANEFGLTALASVSSSRPPQLGICCCRCFGWICFGLYNCMCWPVLTILPIPLCSWLKGAPPGTLPKQHRAKKKIPSPSWGSQFSANGFYYLSAISQTPSIRPLGVAHFYDAFSTCHELDIRNDALRAFELPEAAISADLSVVVPGPTKFYLLPGQPEKYLQRRMTMTLLFLLPPAILRNQTRGRHGLRCLCGKWREWREWPCCGRGPHHWWRWVWWGERGRLWA